MILSIHFAFISFLTVKHEIMSKVCFFVNEIIKKVNIFLIFLKKRQRAKEKNNGVNTIV